jgi:azurin
MNTKHSLIRFGFATLLAAVTLTGCGQSGPPVARDDLPVKKLEITGNDKMKFNVTKLEAQARQRIELTLKNVGSMPKQSMGHNWCLLTLGTDPKAFAEAGLAAASTDYITPDRMNEVIAHTKILGPGESETITFTAPAKPGSYPYICTFPGHVAAGMKGVLEISE